MIIQKIKNILRPTNGIKKTNKIIKDIDKNIIKIQKQEKNLETQTLILMVNKDRLEDKIKELLEKCKPNSELNDKLIIQEYYKQIQRQEDNINKLKDMFYKIVLKKEQLTKNKAILIAKKESFIFANNNRKSLNKIDIKLDEEIDKIDCYIEANEEINPINIVDETEISFEKIRKKYNNS